MTVPGILERLATPYKLNPIILRRVELLGKLNDRHKRATAERDKAGLIELAGEYSALGMVRTANAIRLQAENL